ncbi:hypothetical protein G7B40_039785 [Aetokthonos hydrillicola Thurmond2011]|jgi:hypothetical protein|uniref:Uncharacterized protein n=1 Tax=Aetokthonos hydrillicola Thurmond2011 TaxID=2712845 RepID=A0AAP5ME74_9CYAN|nr:hypothetical protein [Aetokthonos hydrillicola]MBW4590136.1 hypothetical protein [Aetokthonos hydrillicola CCALA 1050]MDR9900633.1 hypothetical protein [Aetokthonos hydrillicola Thurmond2011]
MENFSKPQTHNEVVEHISYIEKNLIDVNFSFNGNNYKISDYYVQRFTDTTLSCLKIGVNESPTLFLLTDVLEFLSETKQQKDD